MFSCCPITLKPRNRKESSTMSSSKVTCKRFPFEKMDHAIRDTMPKSQEARDRFEFEVLHFFAGFLFFFCKKAKREDIWKLSAFAEKEIRTYFPQLQKNYCLSSLPGTIPRPPHRKLPGSQWLSAATGTGYKKRFRRYSISHFS